MPTRKRHTETQPPGSGEPLQAFFASLPMGVLVLETDETISSVNGALLSLLGRERDELVGRPYREINWSFLGDNGAPLPLEQHPPCLALEQQSAVTGVEMALRGGVGEPLRWFRVGAIPLSFEPGGPKARVGVFFREITQNRSLETALARSDHPLSKILDATQVGILVYKLQAVDRLVLVGANQVAERFLARPREECLGKTLEELLPHAVNTEFPWRYRATALRGFPWRSEHWLRPPGAAPLVLEARAFQMEPGTVAVTLYDITERVRARQALKENQAKLEAIVSSVSEVMVMVDADLKVTWANREAERLLGPNLLGHTCHQILQSREEPCRACPARLALRQGRGVHEREIAYQDPEGIRRALWGRASVVDRDEAGRPRLVLLVYREVTELKALQAEAMHTGHLAALGELAAGVAHEINNPVSGIINCAELILRQGKVKSSPQDLAAIIIREGERIAGIVHSLLSFARHSPEEHEPLDLGPLLEESLALLRARMIKEGVDLVLKSQALLPPVAGRRNHIQQVFLNLLSNARYALNHKFGPGEPGKRLEISLELTKQGEEDRVRIKFRDNGMGIPAKVMDKVFDPFFSTKPVGEGTGLGLSISHGIVTNLGGQLWLQSEEGRFTEVWVELPVWRNGSGAGRDPDN